MKGVYRMNAPKTKRNLHSFIDSINRKRLRNLKRRLQYQKKTNELKSVIFNNSHSLLWVWEFSKKAVLICFIFYVTVQIYAMFVMVKFCDFSYLGSLIEQTGQILQNCVFAYLIKAGLENIGKICFTENENSDDESVG